MKTILNASDLKVNRLLKMVVITTVIDNNAVKNVVSRSLQP